MLPPLAIIGAGSMGGAILHGLVSSQRARTITVTNRTAAKADALADLPGVASIALERTPSGNRDAAAAGLEGDDEFDLELKILCIHRIRNGRIILDQGVGRLLKEEWRIALIRLLHFTNMIQIVTADAVNATDGEKVRRAGDWQSVNGRGDDKAIRHGTTKLYTFIVSMQPSVHTLPTSMTVCMQICLCDRQDRAYGGRIEIGGGRPQAGRRCLSTWQEAR